MKRDLNLGNINSITTHFWAGSLDSHNFHDKDYIQSSKTLIDAAINAEFELMKKDKLSRRKYKDEQRQADKKAFSTEQNLYAKAHKKKNWFLFLLMLNLLMMNILECMVHSTLAW